MRNRQAWEEKLGTHLDRITSALGSLTAVFLAVMLIALWVPTYFLFKSIDTWQLVINTGTTIITFCMVFVIQHTSNRDSRAIQTKLDEIICAIAEAHDDVASIEEKPERVIKQKHDEVHKRLRENE
jgi:low affinity Fe/Cu permease